MIDRSRNFADVFVTVVILFTALALGLAAKSGELAQKAHEHGVGKLNIAVQGREIILELTAPGVDIVGFEHAPSSVDQKKAVRDAVTILKNGAGRFLFPAAASCSMQKSEVASTLVGSWDQDDEHKSHDKHSGDHDRDHKEEKAKETHANKNHDEHHGDHNRGHEEEKAGETHAEFRVEYHFECEQPSHLTHIDVRFFEQFPNARELNSQIIGAKGQMAAELTPTVNRVKF